MKKWKNRILPRGVSVDRKTLRIKVRKFHDGKPLPIVFFGKVTDPGKLDDAIRYANRTSDNLKLNKTPIEDRKEVRWPVAHALKVAIEHMPQWRWFDTALVKFFGSFYYDELYFGNVQYFRPWRLGRTVDMNGYPLPATLNGRPFPESVAPEKRVVDSSVNKDLAFLGSSWECLRRLKKTGRIPNVKLPVENPRLGVSAVDDAYRRRRRVITPKEFGIIMGEASPRMRRRILAALNTGLRQKDVLALRKEYFDPNRNQIEGLMHKVGTSYKIAHNEVLKELVATAEGEQVIDPTNHEREFLKLRKVCREKHGIEDFVFKDFRRTVGMTIIGDDKSQESVLRAMAYLGHSRITTTMRYLGITSSDVKVSGAQLAERWKYPIQTEPTIEPKASKIRTKKETKEIELEQVSRG